MKLTIAFLGVRLFIMWNGSINCTHLVCVTYGLERLDGSIELEARSSFVLAIFDDPINVFCSRN